MAASSLPPSVPTGAGEVLLFSLHNYRIVASLGLDKLSLVAVGVVVDTGAGPNLVRRSALAPDWLRQVVTAKELERVRLRDANNARLCIIGTVTLWLQTGARIVPVTFLVVDDHSVPVILGCPLIDDNAHAILPQDRSIRWTDGSVIAILRAGPFMSTTFCPEWSIRLCSTSSVWVGSPMLYIFGCRVSLSAPEYKYLTHSDFRVHTIGTSVEYRIAI